MITTTTARRTRSAKSPFIVTTLVIDALLMIIIGLWCRFDPEGFAKWANWPPHEHFLHDAGVFQIAIGLMLLAATVWRDVVAVTLAGFIFANGFHALNHIQDRADGGHASDPVLLLSFAALSTVALVVHLRRQRPHASQAEGQR